jgi:drug/metabolite transporter (DMT)-like permease
MAEACETTDWTPPRGAATPARAGAANLAILLALGAAWGLQITLMKAVAGSPLGGAGGLGALISLIAVLHALGLVALGGRYRPDPAQAGFLVRSAVSGFVIPLGAIMAAATLIPAGLIVLIESLTPVATIALVLALGSERVTPERGAAGALGVAAALTLLSGEAASAAGPSAALGAAIAFAAPLSYAVNAAYVARRWPAGLSVRQAAAGEALTAAPLLAPAMLVIDRGAAFTAPLWAWALVAGAAVAGLAQGYLYFLLLRRGSAVFATLGSFVSLAAGVGWGMALLGETHPPLFWGAAALVVAALALAVRGRDPAGAPARSRSRARRGAAPRTGSPA